MERDWVEGAPLHFAGSRFARTRRLVDPGPNRLGNEITARESAINLPPAAAAARIPEHARGAVISGGIRQQTVSGLGIAHREAYRSGNVTLRPCYQHRRGSQQPQS